MTSMPRRRAWQQRQGRSGTGLQDIRQTYVLIVRDTRPLAQQLMGGRGGGGGWRERGGRGKRLIIGAFT